MMSGTDLKVTDIKKYRSEKETVMEALDDVESFIMKMDIFKATYPNYHYEIEITPNLNKRNKNKWVVDLKVIKYEEPRNTQGT